MSSTITYDAGDIDDCVNDNDDDKSTAVCYNNPPTKMQGLVSSKMLCIFWRK